MYQAPGASCGILYYPGLVSCPFYAIPIIMPFLIYEIFYLLVIIGIAMVILALNLNKLKFQFSLSYSIQFDFYQHQSEDHVEN